MYPIEATDATGQPIDWKKTVGLNIGIGVVPEIRAVVFLGERDDEYLPAVHVRLSFHHGMGRYVPTMVGYEGPDVNGTDLRSIRVNEMVQLVASHGIFMKVDPDEEPESLADIFGSGGMPSYTHGGVLDHAKRDGPSEWVLKQVVFTYQLAQIASQPPAKAVQVAFGLTERTAARWIARAKEMGLMVRPSVPGYEKITQLMDESKARFDRGEFRVHEVTSDDLRAWGMIDGEHQTEA